MVELFAPEHARQGLTHDVGFVGAEGTRDDRVVEFISFPAAHFQQFLKIAAEASPRLTVA